MITGGEGEFDSTQGRRPLSGDTETGKRPPVDSGADLQNEVLHIKEKRAVFKWLEELNFSFNLVEEEQALLYCV